MRRWLAGMARMFQYIAWPHPCAMQGWGTRWLDDYVKMEMDLNLQSTSSEFRMEGHTERQPNVALSRAAETGDEVVSLEKTDGNRV